MLEGRRYLDFARDDARGCLLDTVCSLVGKYGASYIKFDFNCDAACDPSGADFADYIAGYRRFLREVRGRNPGIRLEGCASGGLMMDLGWALDFDSFWPTDNQSPVHGLRIAKECRPKMILAGASAYPRKIDFKRFREIADEVGAVLMVDMAHIAGLVAAGLHESPIPYAHVTTTTTHKTLRGPRGGMILSSSEVNEKYNFNKAIFPGIQGGPLMHVIAGKAVCFKEALDPSFKVYAQQIVDNAQALASGLLARDFNLVSGGTDNHLMLVNLVNKKISGKKAERLLDLANITCNKNTVPNDPRSASVTSGIRLGTPAVTTRGLKETDMDLIAEAIALVVEDAEKNGEKAKEIVKSLTDRYPLYTDL